MVLRHLLRVLEGLLWGTALVHASGLWGGIIRWTKGPEFARRRSETEQVAFGLAALVAMSTEPLTYLYYTVHFVEKKGWWGTLILVALLLTHLISWTVPSVRGWGKKIGGGEG